MNLKTWILCSLGAVVAFGTASSRAAALYFEKAPVKAESERTCLSFAADVARNQRFKNVHKSAAEVAGESGGAYVAITCVSRPGQQAVAVVMSTADSFDVARQAGQKAASEVRRIVCFDSPC